MSESSMFDEERTAVASTWQLLGLVFYRPRAVFEVQKQKHTWGRIFILLVVISLVTGSLIDLSSELEVSVASYQNLNTVADAEGDDQVSSGMPMSLYVFSTLFGMAILLFIDALYLRIVGAIMGFRITIDHWFAMVAWARFPAEVLTLLITVVLVATLLVSNGFFGLELSTFKALLFGASYANPVLDLLLDIWLLPEIWVVALLTLGFRDWTGRGTMASVMIVVVPFVVLHVLLWWILR